MPNIILRTGDQIITPLGSIRLDRVDADYIRLSVPVGTRVEREPADLLEQFAGFHRRNPHVLQALIEHIEAATSRVQVHTCYHHVRARLVRERGRSNDKMAEEFIPYFGVLIRLLRPDLQIRTRLQVDEQRLITLCQEEERHASALRLREQLDAQIDRFVDGLQFVNESNHRN